MVIFACSLRFAGSSNWRLVFVKTRGRLPLGLPKQSVEDECHGAAISERIESVNSREAITPRSVKKPV
jgi:hypothetical protein